MDVLRAFEMFSSSVVVAFSPSLAFFDHWRDTPSELRQLSRHDDTKNVKTTDADIVFNC